MSRTEDWVEINRGTLLYIHVLVHNAVATVDFSSSSVVFFCTAWILFVLPDDVSFSFVSFFLLDEVSPESRRELRDVEVLILHQLLDAEPLQRQF